MPSTAAELSSHMLEHMCASPSVVKAERFMELFALDSLRITTLMHKPLNDRSQPPLFASLDGFWSGYRSVLARRVAASELRTTVRVLLEPHQGLRDAHQVTFCIDWMTVMGSCDAEPLSSALLERMGMARPSRMLLVVMYRAERDQITRVWVEIDREGLGAKKDTTLDDVLLSDVFEASFFGAESFICPPRQPISPICRTPLFPTSQKCILFLFEACLEGARKHGAVGAMEPKFESYL